MNEGLKKEAVNTKQAANLLGVADMCCGQTERFTAKALLREQIQQMRSRADNLEAFCNALPEVLPETADRVLWGMVQAVRPEH